MVTPFHSDNGKWGIIGDGGAIVYEAEFTEDEAWALSYAHDVLGATSYDEAVAALEREKTP